MDTRGEVPSAADDAAREMQRQIHELATLTRRRQGLERGSPEYAAALRAEEDLAAAIWRRERLAD